MNYIVHYETKDYGHGSHCRTMHVVADTPEEAESIVRNSRCGVEDVWKVELSQR